ncbi:MAG: endonuclease/exonuclease/phosphatase family protein, partial [Rikenellaceae bacterium]
MRREAKRGGYIRALFRFLASIASYMLALALAIVLISPLLPPTSSRLLPLMGLIAPWLYLANLAVAMFWIIRWRWRIAAPTILVLLGGFSIVSRYAKIEKRYDYGLEDYRGTMKVMSFNVRNMIGDDRQWSTAKLTAYLMDEFPSVVALQEVDDKILREELEGSLVRYYSSVNDNVALLSRYKMVDTGNDIFPEGSPSRGRTQWADLLVGSDTIRVFNIHLISTTIQHEDDRYLSSRDFIADTLRENRLRSIASRLSSQSQLRAGQVDTIAMAIYDSPHPTIICGDFNDTALSYSYHRLSRGFNDTFQSAGTGFPHTFRGFLNTLSIDFILTQEGEFDCLG